MPDAFHITLALTPEQFQYLYRVIVLDVHLAPPVELVQRVFNIRQALRAPIIIDIEAETDGTVPKEGHRDGGVSDEFTRVVAGHGAN